MDKTLTASLVVLAAALAPLAGFDVLPEEQAALSEGVAQAVASIAGLVVVVRGIILRRRAKAAPPAEPQQ